MLYANVYGDDRDTRMLRYGLFVGNQEKARVLCKNYSHIDTFVMCGNAAIVQCSAGQQVYVKCLWKGKTIYGDNKTLFQGMLLHVEQWAQIAVDNKQQQKGTNIT